MPRFWWVPPWPLPSWAVNVNGDHSPAPHQFVPLTAGHDRDGVVQSAIFLAPAEVGISL